MAQTRFAKEYIQKCWNVFVDLLAAFKAFEPNPMQDLRLIYTQTRESGWAGTKDDKIELIPNQAPAVLGAGVVGELPSLNLIGTDGNEGKQIEEVWAEEDEEWFASFTDEEDEFILDEEEIVEYLTSGSSSCN